MQRRQVQMPRMGECLRGMGAPLRRRHRPIHGKCEPFGRQGRCSLVRDQTAASRLPTLTRPDSPDTGFSSARSISLPPPACGSTGP